MDGEHRQYLKPGEHRQKLHNKFDLQGKPWIMYQTRRICSFTFLNEKTCESLSWPRLANSCIARRNARHGKIWKLLSAATGGGSVGLEPRHVRGSFHRTPDFMTMCREVAMPKP